MYSSRIHKQTHRFGIHAPHGLPLYSIIFITCIVLLQQAFFFASFDVSSIGFLNQFNNSQQETAGLIHLKDSQSIIDSFDSTPITLTLYAIPGQDAVTLTIPKSELGIILNNQQLESDANQYDHTSLIPFAGLFTDNTAQMKNYISIDQSVLQAYADQLHSSYYIAPVNAKPTYPLTRSDEQIISITPSAVGYSYGANQIADAISSAAITRLDQAGLSAAIVSPTVAEEFLAKQDETLLSMFTSEVQFTDEDYTYSLSGNNELLAALEPTASTGYTLNLDTLASFLDTWLSPQYTVLPTATSSGKTVDTAAIAGQYAKALRSSNPETPIQITYKNLAIIQDSNPDNNTQLQQLVHDLGQKYDAGITVIQFDKEQINASYDGGRSRVAASTYKLLVAYAVAQDISNGTSQWSDRTYNRTIRACLESMLVYSTNHCAENWVKNEYGYNYINQLADSIGLAGTCFGCGEFTLAATNDQVQLMRMFYESEGIDQAIADIVLDMLDRGRGQNGIPYGSPYKIYNKIGWVPGHYNDTAIIELPNTTIGLSIYTNSNNWGQIRDITSQIVATFE